MLMNQIYLALFQGPSKGAKSVWTNNRKHWFWWFSIETDENWQTYKKGRKKRTITKNLVFFQKMPKLSFLVKNLQNCPKKLKNEKNIFFIKNKKHFFAFPIPLALASVLNNFDINPPRKKKSFLRNLKQKTKKNDFEYISYHHLQFMHAHWNNSTSKKEKKHE